MTQPITVSLVDANPAARENCAAAINRSQAIRVASTYATGEEALRQIPANPPNIVLMDIRLPRMSGIECTARLKARCPNLGIIIFTSLNDHNSIFGALRAGAIGYLLKRTSLDMLVKSIEEAHEGGAPMSASIAQQVVRFFHPQQTESKAEALTRREQELISLLAKGRHYKEIAAALGISVDTVRSHIRRMYEKLNVHSRTEVVLKVLKNKPGSIAR